MKGLHARRGVLVLLLLTSACQQTNTSAATPEKTAIPVPEPASCSDCIPVTVENFPRAESDLYFASPIKQAGGIGKFYHYREAMPIAEQAEIRANRDTLSSAAIFDLTQAR